MKPMKVNARQMQSIRSAVVFLCAALLISSTGVLAQSGKTGTQHTPQAAGSARTGTKALDSSSKDTSHRQRLRAIQNTCARLHQRGSRAWRTCIIEMN